MTLSEYITKHDKTHLIFDFDATLVLMGVPWEKWADNKREEIIELDTELWEAYKDKSATHMQNALVEKHGKRGLDILLRTCPPFELEYSKKFRRNHPLIKEVEDFRGKYHMYIWSSNSSELVHEVLEETGMSQWFEKVVARGELRFLKPSPEGFELLRDPSVPKERYLMIGDSSHDRQAAEAAGIDFYLSNFFNLDR